MNIALQTPGGEFYIACIKKNGGPYIVVGKYILPDGTVRQFGQEFRFDRLEDAEKRCRAMAKMKVRKKGFLPVLLEDLPEATHRHLEIPPDMQLTPEEMIEFVRDARRERYVVFGDVFGIEAYFDLGVEYLALTVPGDDEHFLVYDKYGEKRHYHKDRMESVRMTERSEEASKLGL
jgi:hypothetical protein